MKLRKLTACLLSFSMLAAIFATTLAGTAFAVAGDGTGADLIISNTPATTGISITGKSFNVYEIFTATINEDDAAATDPTALGDTFDYTLTAAFAPFFEAQLEDAFTYPNVADDTTYPHGATDEQYLEDLGIATNAAMDYIHLYDTTEEGSLGTMQDLVELLRAYVLTEANYISPVATTSTGSDPASSGDAQVVYTTDADLMGYYLVLDSADTLTAGSAAITGMLYNMPARASDATLTIDRTVTLKASAPTITKEIWHNDTSAWDSVGDYQIGDTVTFRITASIPTNLTGYTDESYSYYIEDTMSDGLSLVPGSVTIYKDAALTDGVEGALHDVLNTGYYTADHYQEGETRLFSFEFDMVSILRDFPDLGVFYITYDAIVTADAKVSTDGYETNTVELIYSTNPYDDTAVDSVTDTVYSYTFDLDVTKTTGDGVTPLEGAKFSLYIANAIAEGKDSALYFILDPDDDGNAVYYVTSATTTGATTEIITDKTGFFTIVGLDDAITYKLVEIEAPTGYNIADPLSFTITATYEEDGYQVQQLKTLSAGSQIDNLNGNLSTTIINTSSALLPTTGGMGTTLLTYGGIILMVGAASAFFIKRKNPKE